MQRTQPHLPWHTNKDIIIPTLNNHFLLPLLKCTMEGPTFLLISKLYGDSTGIAFLIHGTKANIKHLIYI